jgi:hypothetical protein
MTNLAAQVLANEAARHDKRNEPRTGEIPVQVFGARRRCPLPDIFPCPNQTVVRPFSGQDFPAFRAAGDVRNGFIGYMDFEGWGAAVESEKP